jgi:drug/metabolite transporter (DMT)-like permease
MLMMLAVVAVWGSTFVLIKDALADVSPLFFNLLRMALAFCCLAIVYRAQWNRLTPRAWRGGAVVGFFLAMGYQFQTAGLLLTTPSKSAFLTGLTVVMVPLLAAFPTLRAPETEAPRWNVWLGAILAFGGIVLLTNPSTGAASGLGLTSFGAVNKGDILSLICALGFALQLIAQDHFSRAGNRQKDDRVPFEQLAMLQIGFATLFMAITSPLFEKPSLHFSAQFAVALMVAAFLATAAAFSIMSWAQQLLPPAQMALILAIEPVFAWLASLIVLHQGLSGGATLGALLILAGMAAAERIGMRI